MSDYTSDTPIHDWFGLTYAQYLTIPRSILQSMPIEWQRDFVSFLNDLDEAFDWRPTDGYYQVLLRDRDGHYIPDPLKDYERGRRKIQTRVGER